ncbi:hypothetical protein [Novosphingopyxis sp.]|uniref:hypothetical protein n=1 Tax=Novosphingopyxis sp. TaxID=2709690 RepID=UPI003B5CC33C
MSGLDKAYGAIKSIMLANERFDRIEGEMKELSGDLGSLAKSHAELAERVAGIEGYLKGAGARQKWIEGK